MTKKENEWRRIMRQVSRSNATAVTHDFATRNLGTKVDQNSRITKNLGNGMVNDVNGDGRFSKRDLFNSDLDSDEVEKISNFILLCRQLT